MVSVLYVGAVAFYFLVLYPYIVTFISWAVWAIEGLPPPAYQKDFKEGRLMPSSDARTHMREEVRRLAKLRSGEETETDKKSCPLTKSKSWIRGYCSNRRTRLDQIMCDARDAEEGHSVRVEDTSNPEEPRTPSGKGKERAFSPHRSFTVQPKGTQHPHGVELIVYMRVVAGSIFFHAVFCALPFWFKAMKYTWTQQMMLPLNMHDQD
ncbi:hypothetical protein F503_07152 [Ophiostoma piceae UAMH 11346]|uniref:Uncharacterized protein n=1 Tax=Ophiostoma piceae (strain UAMH 11346) TaxID=1262450 RepID=S3CBN4_OPHP1|nr:hypothetical protein F503_07152 [Ophiostoma piceae UAMH 11346]